MSGRTWAVSGMAAALGGYGYAMTRIVHGLTKIKPGKNDWQYSMSVIVPARNEEATIRKCLEGLLEQDYPKYFYEIIVVNDRSTDRTAAIVEELCRQNPRIRLVNITEVPAGVAPKKNAVVTGIQHAIGRIIVTTDADCDHPKTWLKALNREFAPDVGVVVGHTVYRTPRNWFEGLQAVDYLSHRIVGAGTIGEGEALNSTASNLAYRREVYDEVGGFGEARGIVSGDDDLFLQRVHTMTSWRIVAPTSPESFVATQPVSSVTAFLNQRARWASKSTNYHAGVFPFLVATFLLLLLIAFSLPFAIRRPKRWALFWALLAAKAGIDFNVMKTGSRMFRQQELMKYFWLAEILMPFYVVAAVFWGLFGKFAWKGSLWGRRVGATA